MTSPAEKASARPRCGAVIVAAGSAARMAGIDKVMTRVAGKPLVWHSVEAFLRSDEIDEIVEGPPPAAILQLKAKLARFEGRPEDALALFTGAGLPARALAEPDFPISLEQELIVCLALVRRLARTR